jgi:hypothetical protein
MAVRRDIFVNIRNERMSFLVTLARPDQTNGAMPK